MNNLCIFLLLAVIGGTAFLFLDSLEPAEPVEPMYIVIMTKDGHEQCFFDSTLTKTDEALVVENDDGTFYFPHSTVKAYATKEAE